MVSRLLSFHDERQAERSRKATRQKRGTRSKGK